MVVRKRGETRGTSSIDKEYLDLLERLAEEARIVDRVMISYLTEDTETLNLTGLMEAVGDLNEYGERKRGLPQ